MKISLFILSALLSSTVYGQASLRHSRRLELQSMLQSDDHRELLEQPECKGHLNALGKEMMKLVHEGDKDLTNYVCNKIGRKDNKAALKAMKKSVNSRRALLAGASKNEICIDGIHKMLLSGKSKKGVEKGTKDMKGCKEEMADELKVMHDNVPELNDDRIRFLLETDPDHRELWNPFAKIGSFVNNAVSTVSNVATTAFNRVKQIGGGLVDGAANAISGIFSDRRLKYNIKMVGSSPSGIPVYTYQYKSSAEAMDGKATYSGVMAQDLLENNHADAVMVDKDGFYKVDYEKIDVDFHKLN